MTPVPMTSASSVIGGIDLSLGRMLPLLERLGNPQRKVPPVIHVTGTNGKGSTIAFLRAMLEAAGSWSPMRSSPMRSQNASA